jgi:DUF4097 and DUF4098 domain-containing protein YvlB
MNHIRLSGFAGALILMLAIALLVSPAGAVSKETSKDLMFNEEFSLKPGGKLTINVEDIDFEIRTGADAVSSVTLYVSGKNREKAAEYFEKLKFSASLNGNELVLETRKNRVNIIGFWNGFRNVRAWAVVTVPEKIDVEINTEDGDVLLESIAGNASIRTEDGDIELSGITGGSIKIHTEDGDVEADVLEGGTVTVSSEDGDVKIRTLTSGDVSIDTEDGDLVIDRISGDTVRLSSEDGDVEVERVDSDEIVVHTEDGDITMIVSGKRLQGKCEDGDVKIDLMNEMEVIISAADGDIFISVPKDSNADLDLSGENVNLMSKISIEGRVSKKHIKGTLNNGGPLIKIKLEDGTIIFSEK